MRRTPVILAVLLGLGVFLVHVALPASEAGGDTLWSVQVGYSVLHRGNVYLDEFPDLTRVTAVHTTVLGDGHRVYNFPWATSVISVPTLGVYDGILHVVGDSMGSQLHRTFPAKTIEIRVSSVYVAVSAALLFVLLLRRTRRKWVSLVVSASFAFGTSMLSTGSRALWMHSPSVMLLLVALLLVQIIEDDSTRHVRGRVVLLTAVCGIVLGLAYVVRPTDAIPAAVLLGVIGARRVRLSFILLAGASLPIAALIWIDERTWGVPLAPYYTSGQRLGVSRTLFQALVGNLVSPARGLLIWSPFVVLAAVGVYRAFQSPMSDRVRSASVVIIGLHWIAISAVQPWWAGASVGPRLFTDALPFVMVLVADGVVAAVDLARGRRRSVALAGVTLTVAFSVFVNVRAADRTSVQAWNFSPQTVDAHSHRVWDWADPQFLR